MVWLFKKSVMPSGQGSKSIWKRGRHTALQILHDAYRRAWDVLLCESFVSKPSGVLGAESSTHSDLVNVNTSKQFLIKVSYSGTKCVSVIISVHEIFAILLLSYPLSHEWYYKSFWYLYVEHIFICIFNFCIVVWDAFDSIRHVFLYKVCLTLECICQSSLSTLTLL